MLDLLDQMGCVVVGVDVDDDGPTVAGLRAALAGRRRARRDAAAAGAEPGRLPADRPPGQGAGRRPRRERRRSSSRTTTPTTSPPTASSASATWLPARTVHIRSYSKSHGPDLRLAAVGGAGDVVTAVANRRLLGPGWSSRILQALLLELLQDPATPAVMARAREVYAHRRALVCDVLAAAGVGVSGVDGINLWVRVADERSAAVALAARGIGVAPGEPFLVRPDDDHLRVTVGLLTGPDDHVREVATHLAHAAGHPPTRQTHHR